MWTALRPHQFRSGLQPSSADYSPRARSGFTIVELLIVIVVIGILATLVIVAYNGIRTRAEDVSLQSEAGQAARKVLAYTAENSDALPVDMAAAGFTAGPGREVFYRVTPDGKNFCVAVNITGSPTRAFSATSTNPAAKKGTCQGYILVPGNDALGTSDFWVMKYEAKNMSGVAMSWATGTPWVSISQTQAISTSAAACDGCHLISEAEWMTIAANALSVSSNWSGGSVGSGYTFNGHNDNTPAAALAIDGDPLAGYNGTGNSWPSSQRRTLNLSNGEVIWDLAGNVYEWTSQAQAMSNVGASSDSGFNWREWTSGSLSLGNLPVLSRPSALSSMAGLSSVTSWNGTQGIGGIYANYADTGTRAFMRGGNWDSTSSGAGVLTLHLGPSPSYSYTHIGFRVAR